MNYLNALLIIVNILVQISGESNHLSEATTQVPPAGQITCTKPIDQPATTEPANSCKCENATSQSTSKPSSTGTETNEELRQTCDFSHFRKLFPPDILTSQWTTVNPLDMATLLPKNLMESSDERINNYCENADDITSFIKGKLQDIEALNNYFSCTQRRK